MPWEPLQARFCTRILVLLGLNETQPSSLLIWLFWIVIESERYVSQPSVFLAVLLEVEKPDMLMSENTTAELLATKM